MSRAQEIVDVVVNSQDLHNDAIQLQPLSVPVAFSKYSRLVARVSARYSANRWESFTLEEMAQAIVLLNERYSEKD